MPDNLKVGLMVAEQRKICASGGCTGEYYGLGFGQSPFHVPPVLFNALSDSADKGLILHLKGYWNYVRRYLVLTKDILVWMLILKELS